MKEPLVVDWDDVCDFGINRPTHGTIPISHHAEIVNKSCGDRVHIALNVVDGVIVGAWAEGTGCILSQGLAHILCKHAVGLTLEECKALDPVLDFEISPIRKKCAVMAVEALHEATCHPCN